MKGCLLLAFVGFFAQAGFSQNGAEPTEVIYLKDRPASEVIYPVNAEVISLDPNKVKGFGMNQVYNIADGLASDRISVFNQGVYCDSKGNIWIGSWGEGVSMYDGQSFTTYNTNHGLNSPVVTNIIEDKWGNVWLGTLGAGINKFDGKTFTSFTQKVGLAGDVVYCSAEDSKGHLWFGFEDGGVSKFDGESFINYRKKNGFTDSSVGVIYEDRNNILWFGTDRGLYNYDGQKFNDFTDEKWSSGRVIVGITEDKEGNLWIGTFDGGLIKHDGVTFTPSNLIPESLTTKNTKEGDSYLNISMTNVLQFLRADSGGDLWAGFQNSIARFNGERLLFSNFEVEDFVSMTEDKHGNLWFGSWGGGLIKYESDAVSRFTTELGLLDNSVEAIEEDRQGNLWFGTEMGVSRFDGTSFINYKSGNELFSGSVRCIKEDSQGNIWIGGYGGNGVSMFDGQSFTNFSTQQGLVDNNISYILENRKGNIWFAGRADDGISKFDGERFTNYDLSQFGLNNPNKVRCMVEDDQGHLWLGTGIGLIRFDGSGFSVYTKEHGLAGNNIYSLLKDSKDNIWIGSLGEGGLTKYNGENFTIYSTAHGLYDNSIEALEEDQQGNIIVGTHFGISIIPEGDINNGVEVYNQSTGYPIGTVSGKAILCDKDGNIWIGSGSETSSLVKFDYEAVKKLKHTSPPDVILKNIAIRGNRICWYDLFADVAEDSTLLTQQEAMAYGHSLSSAERDSVREQYADVRMDGIRPFHPIPENLVLPYAHNALTFSFNAIETGRNFMVNYQYKLEGMDEDWSPVTKEAKATYTNLFEGNYTFMLKAQSPWGVWSEPLTYSFTVLPPWYRSWWGYLLWVGLSVGIFYAIYRYNLRQKLALAETRRIKELDTMKSRLYTNITHEFRTPLTVMLGMAEQIKGHIQEKKLITRNGKNLLRMINQMLDLTKLESGSLKPKPIRADIIVYLQYLVESFHSLANEKAIHLTFYSEEENLTMDYDEEIIQHIVYNLLSNALKFTPEGGKVIMHVKEVDSGTSTVLQIKVKDTGPGIPEEQLPFIFDRFYQVDSSTTRKAEGTGIGLTFTRDLVELIQGKIQVKSAADRGTEFTLTLPISNKAKLKTGKRSLPLKMSSVTIPTEDKVTDTPPDEGGDMDHLLIIEDNRDVVIYIKSILKDKYAIQTAPNGKLGLEKAIEYIPDIIISDVMMPEMNGYQVCESLKQDERTSHIPVILLTAKAGQDDRLEGLQYGSDAYLSKPFDKRELLIRLEKLIALRKQMQQFYSQSEQRESTHNNKREHAFLQRLEEIVEAQLSDPDFDIPELARKAGMSQTQVYRKLKALTGKTPSAFIRSIRLRKGKQLLISSDKNISEIAYEVGFSDPNYFSKTFHEEFKRTPSECRG